VDGRLPASAITTCRTSSQAKGALCSRSNHSTLTPTKLPLQQSGAPSTLSSAEEAATATLREIMDGERVCACAGADMHVCIDWCKRCFTPTDVR
jgi:hypothetical protein